ncbi:hypothetical protein B0H19DRAFT_481269 [Mycena capillaripes]|nr:hypothetical protein B0H19DRAFT_481269 [Mycena capillaripes]
MPDSSRLPCLDNATQSLYSLSSMAGKWQFPLDAASDLWPRVWPWIEFIHTYWDYFPDCSALELPFLRVAHSILLVRLKDHNETWKVMSTTRNVRRIIAAAWATMLPCNDTPDGPHATLKELTKTLFALSSQRDDLKNPENWEEVIGGCGGSYADLAIVVTKHLSQATAAPKSEMAVGALTSVLMLLQPLYEVYEDFTSTLLSHGIIPALVSALAIDGLAPPVVGLPHRPVDLCMAMIVEYIQTSPGYPWIAEALQAGLLRYIVSFMEKMIEASFTRGMYSDLKELLCTVLPSGLVSYTVVTQIKESFSEIQEASQSQKFSRSVLFEDWTVFKTLVEQRVSVLDTWESSGRPSFLACDNLKCGKIAEKEQFRCCSAC